MRYLKPVNKKILKEVVHQDHAVIGRKIRVEDAIGMFEEAAWHFTEKQYVTMIANIIATRAERLGGGQFIDAITKELQERKPLVIEYMYD
jgi:hypothetical protein